MTIYFLRFWRLHKLTFRIKGLYYLYPHCLKSRSRRKLSLEITFTCPYASKQCLTVPLRMRRCFTGRYRKSISPVNNMLPGWKGANLPGALALFLWSWFLTSPLPSWHREELTVHPQRARSQTTCVKNSRPKCCVCCQRPPMGRLSTARARQVSCGTSHDTCARFTHGSGSERSRSIRMNEWLWGKERGLAAGT